MASHPDNCTLKNLLRIRHFKCNTAQAVRLNRPFAGSPRARSPRHDILTTLKDGASFAGSLTHLSCVHRNELPTGSEALPAPKMFVATMTAALLSYPQDVHRNFASVLRLSFDTHPRLVFCGGTANTCSQVPSSWRRGMRKTYPTLIQNRTLETALLLLLKYVKFEVGTRPCLWMAS